jgi:anthranilate phosphoribosyltransferase
MNILRSYVGAFRDGTNLRSEEAEIFLDSLITETDEMLLGDLFRSWNDKGIAENEIYEIARIMRTRCTRVSTRHERFVDIVGTGGSRAKTFNVSTAAAFVVAGAGVPVAKHGNKAATSISGSADVLSALGVMTRVDAKTAGRLLDEIGICFMFAPNFHSLSPTLSNVRRGLGFPTIFNCVGPLCNPAGAPHQLIGVWSGELVPKMANALARLGTKKSWIVHGDDGLDEISVTASTRVAEVEGNTVRSFELVHPTDASALSLEGVRNLSAQQSAELVRSVLQGCQSGKTAEAIVTTNAAAALYLSGRAADLDEGHRMALHSIHDGSAFAKLDELVSAENA